MAQFYNRYIPEAGGYVRRPAEDGPLEPPPPPPMPEEPVPPPPPEREAERGLLHRLLGRVGLEKLDTGDILLLLILFFLFREGDDMELVLTLGLLLLLGLEDE